MCPLAGENQREARGWVGQGCVRWAISAGKRRQAAVRQRLPAARWSSTARRSEVSRGAVARSISELPKMRARVCWPLPPGTG